MRDAPRGADPDRFAPRATRALAGMFDEVSGRYDLLNRLMSLGRDRAWRADLAAAVPSDAVRILDLCCGTGESLQRLRRPGRLLLGVDASLRMLGTAALRLPRGGWAARLVCADAFRLPLRDGSLDAITIAFGVRNLRPRGAALAEFARVLRAGGTLAVLEATAPAPGPLAGLHAFFLRRAVPWLGRLSDEPTAYDYLSASIFEFGAGPGFEADLAAGGFAVAGRRRFLLGAARRWACRRLPEPGQPLSAASPGVRGARPPAAPDRGRGGAPGAREREWRLWIGLQAAIAGLVTAGIAIGLVTFANWSRTMPLDAGQKQVARWILAAGLVLFSLRTAQLLLRRAGPPPDR